MSNETRIKYLQTPNLNKTPVGGDVAETDSTLSIQGMAADAKAVGERVEEYDSLKNTFMPSENVPTGIFSKTNPAASDNGDGSYNIGSTDYGTVIFAPKLTLKAGKYILFGVPVGFSFLSTTEVYTGAIATNDTMKEKEITVESDGEYYLGYRNTSRPSAAYVIRPYLKCVAGELSDQQRQHIVGDYGLTPKKVDALIALLKQVYFKDGSGEAFSVFESAWETKDTTAPKIQEENKMYVGSGIQSKDGLGATIKYQLAEPLSTVTLCGICPTNKFSGREDPQPAVHWFDADGDYLSYHSMFIRSGSRWMRFVGVDSLTPSFEYNYSPSAGITIGAIAASVDMDFLDDSYMYVKETGQVLFAGKYTPYYGMTNISESEE